MPQFRVDSPTTTIQPAPATQPTDIAAAQALSGAQLQGEKATQEVAGVVQQFATQVMRDETMKMAQRDAAQITSFDPDTGKPIVNTEARGIGGILYNQVFSEAAVAKFKQDSMGDFNNQIAVAQAKFPGQPDKVREALTPYVEGALKSMPEEFRTVMTPHYSAAMNGAISSATAGKARSDLQGIADGLPQVAQSLTLDIAHTMRSNEWGGLSEESKTPQQKVFEDRLDDIDKRKRALNISEETIQRDRQAILRNAETHSRGMQFAEQILRDARDPVNGQINAAESRIKAIEQIDELTKANTTEALDQRKILMDYIQRADSLAQQKDQVLRLQIEQTVSNISMKAMGIQGALVRNEITQPQASAALAQLDSERSVAMIGQRATHQLQIMSAGRGIVEAAMGQQTAENVAIAKEFNAKLQDTYSATLTNAIGMQTSGLTAAHQAEGHAQVRDIYNDPNVNEKALTDSGYAAIKASAGRAIAEYTGRSLAVDKFKGLNAISSGIVDPQYHAEYINELREKNLLDRPGGISSTELVQAMETGTKNFDILQRRKLMAAQGLKAWNAGHMISDQEAEAIRLQNANAAPGGTSNGTTSVDDAGNLTATPAAINQDSVKQALAQFNNTGAFSDPHAKAMAALPITADKEQQKAAIDLYRGTEQIIRQRIGKNFSGPVEEGEVVAAYMKQKFGEKARDQIEAYENGYANQTADKIAKALEGDKSGLPANVTDPINVMARLGGTMADAAAHPDGFWQGLYRNVYTLGGILPTSAAMGWNAIKLQSYRAVLGAKLPSDATEQSLRMSPDVTKDATNWIISKYLPKNYYSDLKAGLDPIKQGGLAYMMEKIGDLDIATGKDENGNVTHTMQKDGFNRVFNKANNIDWSEDTNKQFLAAKMQQLNPRLQYDVNWGTFQISQQRDEQGKVLYKASAMSINNQGQIDLGYVDPKDPRWRSDIEEVGRRVMVDYKKLGENSMFARLWTLQFYPEETKKEMTAALVKAEYEKNLTSETWVGLVKSAAGVLHRAVALGDRLGGGSGIRPLDMSSLANVEWGQAIKKQGALSVIFGGPQKTTVPIAQGRGEYTPLQVPPEVTIPPPLPADVTTEAHAAAARDVQTDIAGRTGDRMKRKLEQNPPSAFDPRGDGYDLATAKAAGMTPQAEPGPNQGHMGSVAEVSAADRKKYNLPDEAYIMLKGRKHETWDLGVKGEEERGFKVVKLGDRYYSVPKTWRGNLR